MELKETEKNSQLETTAIHSIDVSINDGKRTNWLHRPWSQLLLISCISFCAPGMYNSINGIGGGGQLDPTVAANATVARLSATAATAFTIVPTIFDALGPRGCLLISGWTYPLYAASLLCYNHTHNAAFVIASGAILGVGAAFLWTAQGYMMLSYPPENQRGRAIGWFWVIYNVGGAVGGFISFALNFRNNAGTVSNSTYVAFMVVMAFGWLLSVFVVSPSCVIHSDGSVVTSQKFTKQGLTIPEQIKAFIKAYYNWRIIVFIPMFFCANMPYSYQQNDVNGASFTIRSRSLNSALYWLAQVFGGPLIGFLLDISSLRRRTRSRLAWVLVFVLTSVIWGGGLKFQLWKIMRNTRLDFSDAGKFVGPCFLYIFYGMYDAIFQGTCYWVMGALSNDPHTIARYVALYKTLDATGGAMAWRINALHTPALKQFAINWGLLGGALLIGFPSMWWMKDMTGELGISNSMDIEDSKDQREKC